MVRLQTSEKSHKKLLKVEIFKFLSYFKQKKNNNINHINDDKETKITEKLSSKHTHTHNFLLLKKQNKLNYLWKKYITIKIHKKLKEKVFHMVFFISVRNFSP